MSGGAPAGEGRILDFREQMQDAQSKCLPCKLCGGRAVISDAGIGAGYYIACENSASFRSSNGCLIDQRRIGGWAYNVMEWWNRLMATPTPPSRDADVERFCNPIVTPVDGEIYVLFDAPDHSIAPFCMDRDHAQALHTALSTALQALGERG